MYKHLKQQRHLSKLLEQRPYYWLVKAGLLLFSLLVACSPSTETITIEVTRVVTETVVEEGIEIEVTRVVTETVTETVEIEPEEEAIPGGELPSAIGSEGDAEPLPPPPDNGPKVAESRGSSSAAELTVETAVALRANQTNDSLVQTAPVVINFTDLQKLCAQITKTHKKRCV